jgi:hypothetical protein
VRALFLVFVLAGCAAKPPADSKWWNVTDGNNEVVAGVDVTTGKVKYYQSQDKAFQTLFGATMKYMQECPCCKDKCEKFKPEPTDTKKK